MLNINIITYVEKRAYNYTWNRNKNGRIGRIGRNQFDFGLQNGRNGQIRLLHKKLII